MKGETRAVSGEWHNVKGKGREIGGVLRCQSQMLLAKRPIVDKGEWRLVTTCGNWLMADGKW